MSDMVYLSDSDYNDDDFGDDDDDSFQSALETPLEDSFLMTSTPTYSVINSEDGDEDNSDKSHSSLDNTNNKSDDSNTEDKNKEEEGIIQSYSFVTRQEEENFENGYNDIGSSSHTIIVGSIYWSEKKDDSHNILVMGTDRGYLIIDTLNPKVIFRDENNNRSCSLAWLLEGTSLLSLVYQDDPRTLLYMHVNGRGSSVLPQNEKIKSNVITTTAYAHAILRVQVMTLSTDKITNNTGVNKNKKNRDFHTFVLLKNGDLLVHDHTDTSCPKFIISTLFPPPSYAGIKNNNVESNQRSLLKPQISWTVGWLWDCSDTTLVTKYGRSKIKIRPLTLIPSSNQTDEEITIETRHETSLTRIRINSSIIITCDLHGMTCNLYQLPHGIPYRDFQLYRGSSPCTIHSITLLNNSLRTDDDNDSVDKIGLWSDHGTIHVFSDWKSKPKHQFGIQQFWNRRSNQHDIALIPATWKISIKEHSKSYGALTFTSDSKVFMATKDGTVLGYSLFDAKPSQVCQNDEKLKSAKPCLAENILLW